MKQALLPILCLFVISCGRGNIPPFEPQEGGGPEDKAVQIETYLSSSLAKTKNGTCWYDNANEFKDFTWEFGADPKLLWAELQKGTYQLTSQIFYGSRVSEENALPTDEYIITDATPPTDMDSPQITCKSELSYANKDFRTIKSFFVLISISN